jgi:hypothetical protein
MASKILLNYAKKHFLRLQKVTYKKTVFYKYLNLLFQLSSCVTGSLITYNSSDPFLLGIPLRILGLWICIQVAINQIIDLKVYQMSNLQVYQTCKKINDEIDIKIALLDEYNSRSEEIPPELNREGIVAYIRNIYKQFSNLELISFTEGGIKDFNNVVLEPQDE